MADPNEQRVVNGKMVIVTLLASGREVAISVGDPGNPSHPIRVGIEPLLAGGLDARGALHLVMEIAAAATQGATA